MPTYLTPQADDHVLIIGDSTADPGGLIPIHSSSLQWYDWNWNSSLWTDKVDTGQQCWAPDFAFFWNSNRTRTVGTINGAVSGTRLMTHWQDFSTPGGYPDRLRSGWVTSGSPSILCAICAGLGANDVGGEATKTAAQYRDGIKALADWVAATFTGAPSLYFSVFADDAPPGGDPEDAGYVARMNNFRQGVNLAYAAGYCRIGPNWTGMQFSDQTHPNTLLQGAILGRGAYLCTNSGLEPPKVVSATYNVARTVTSVTFDKDLGNSVSSSVAGFRMFDNGVRATVSGAVVSAVRVVAVTHTAIVGAPTISFAHAEDAIGQTIPVGVTQTLADASTYRAPALPFFAVAATEAPGGTGRFANVFASAVR